MTIDQCKELFDKKIVKIKIGDFLFEDIKIKFNKETVQGFHRKTKLLAFEIMQNTFLELVSNVNVSMEIVKNG